MRHCATSRKVAGSILDGFTVIFHYHNLFGRTVAPGVDTASNRNEYQEYLLVGKGDRCAGLTTFPFSCADCLEILEPQPPGTLRVFPGLYRDCFAFQLHFGLNVLEPLGPLQFCTGIALHSSFILTSTSWKPQGLSSSVQGLLYIPTSYWPQSPGTLRAFPGLYMDCFTFQVHIGTNAVLNNSACVHTGI